MSLNIDNIKYLAIQGAGGKGAAYLGVLSALESEDLKKILDNHDPEDEKYNIFEFKQLEGIAGTSAGSITALMLSLGFSANETNKMVIENPLFMLAISEKSNTSRYRAYKSTKDEDIIGFTAVEEKKYKRKIEHFKNVLNEDKYTLSNKNIDFFQKNKEDKYRTFLEKKPIKSFNNIVLNSLLSSLLKSITEPIILENIGEGLFEEFQEEFENYKKKRDFLKKANNILEDKLGFKVDLFTVFFDSIEELITSIFINWEEDLEQGARNFFYLYAIFIGIFLIQLELLTTLLTNSVYKTEDSICSVQNKRKQERYKNKQILHTVIKLIWNSNIPRVPILTPLYETLIELSDFALSPSKDNFGKRIFKTVNNISSILVQINNNGIRDLFPVLNTRMPELLKALIKPVEIIFKRGGLLDGSRVRFIFARLIYEKVEVEETETKKYIFKRRKKDLPEELREEFNTIFFKTKKIKLYNQFKQEYIKLEKEYEKYQNEFLSEEEVFNLNLAVDKLKKDLKNSKINNQMQSYFQSNDKKRNLKDKLDLCKELLDILKIRNDLEIIEKYYTFEEHYKIFRHEFVLVSSNITSGESVYFNRHLTPDFPVGEACGASMNIPIFWRPIAIDYVPKIETGIKKEFYKKHYYGWFVDGGINENIPLFAFNGYKDKPEEAPYWSPIDMAANATKYFPYENILGISNFGGYCRGGYTGGDDAKIDKQSGNWNSDSFSKKPNFMKVANDIYNSMFEYSYKLRGFEMNKSFSELNSKTFSEHILSVDYGFMGMFEFAANTEELFRIEANNYNYTRNFFGKSLEKEDKIIHKFNETFQKRRKEYRRGKWSSMR